MALSLYKHNQYGTLSYEQVDSNWSQIESDVNGLSSRLPLNNYAATTDPTVNDDVTQGYSTGSLWYNRTTDTAFVLTNASSGAANWVERDSISAADLGSAAFADILGTVSQSGGVPTGALFERGSNANGEYFKYAGGMMLCKAALSNALTITLSSGSAYTSDEIEWDFPSTFASPDVIVLASIRTPAPAWCRGRVASSSHGLIKGFSLTSVAGTSSVDVLSIGRWFN